MLLYFLQENPGHDSLAITVCNEILTNPESSSLKLFDNQLIRQGYCDTTY
jgi:hypothetical protein